MPVSVSMPQLGESVTEGTVTRWLKHEGDHVSADEPLLEVSTDKVDTEIPSPVSGILRGITVAEDETVAVGAELAVIDEDGAASASAGDGAGAGAGAAAAPAPEAVAPEAVAPGSGAPGQAEPAWQLPAAASYDAPAYGQAQPSYAEPPYPSAGYHAPEPGQAAAPAAEPQDDHSGYHDSGYRFAQPEPHRYDEAHHPEYGAQQPEYGAPQPEYGAQQPEYGAQQPEYGAGQEPGYTTAQQPEYGAGYGTGESEPAPASVQYGLAEQQSEPAGHADGADGGGADGPYVTPLVRKLAVEHGIDLAGLTGTGVGGRIRKQDVLEAARAQRGDEAPSSAYAQPAAQAPVVPAQPRPAQAPPPPAATQPPAPAQAAAPPAPPAAPPAPPAPPAAPPAPAAAPPAPPAAPPAPPTVQPTAPPAQPTAPPGQPTAPPPGLGTVGYTRPPAPAGADSPAVAAAKRGTTERLSRARQVIAQRMVESLQTSAQLTTVVEADVTAIARLRDRAKASFEAREGVKLSFLPFFALATVEALKVHPKLNSVLDTASGTVTYHDAEHLGIAVDTDRGLMVPVIKNAGDLNIGGLARKIADLAQRTRAGQVSPDDLSGGTFTLTNTGSRGALFDTPIINQPQVGILGTGTVNKRAVVVDDPDLGEVITVRSIVYLALTYDHRLIDGADAARFLVTIKNRLQEGHFETELGR
jgi:pyruvate dehydrogenase E2 component (dihydrolipoamide acetyltransferase)